MAKSIRTKKVPRSHAATPNQSGAQAGIKKPITKNGVLRRPSKGVSKAASRAPKKNIVHVIQRRKPEKKTLKKGKPPSRRQRILAVEATTVGELKTGPKSQRKRAVAIPARPAALATPLLHGGAGKNSHPVGGISPSENSTLKFDAQTRSEVLRTVNAGQVRINVKVGAVQRGT
eukprot:GHVT01011207.1.p1 GENE.GHVT01011207.1~~GHVT01011207.1.p1  ORF type:complete len:174 (+),score=17.47 GHVT01011207.1:175-696(+)